MFNNLNEALDWLYGQKKLKKREDLSRIGYLIKKLNIKFNYKIVHIAGTNGKGSTASFIKKMLQLSDKKVGLFVSPFVIKFNERIQINGNYITDEEIIKYCNYLYDIADSYYLEFNDTVPFFELTFLMSLLYFDDKKN
jgi:dihydrofolate synthase/folylpolyglutamate synthase